jgi:hypothetical protein
MHLEDFLFLVLFVFLLVGFFSSEIEKRYRFSRSKHLAKALPKGEEPPCANWQVWTGKEIEGFTYINHKTLFVRSLKLVTLDELRADYPKINRIWFCQEMLAEDQQAMARALDMWACVCVECFIDDVMIGDIWKRAHIYLKLPFNLTPMKDHICIGEAFHDEAFQIGTGRKVNPVQYLDDERIM